MTRFGDLARKRMARRESGAWDAEARVGEELCHTVEQFRSLDDSTRTGWSASYRERRKQQVLAGLEVFWPDLDGEKKGDVLSTLTDPLSRWNRNERRLDSLADAEIPHTDPFASGEPEELTFAILKQDTTNDRRDNILYSEYFLNQSALNNSLHEPFDEFQAFSHWLAAKTLIYGLEFVPHFPEMLKKYYLKTNVKQLRQFRLYAQRNNLAKMRDPYGFLYKVFGEFPELFEICGGMLQTYADAVRTERSVLDKATRDEFGLLPDTPNIIADLRKQDLWQLRQRIRNAYVSTGDFKRVAKAFERKAADIRQLLIEMDVMEHRGMRLQAA